MTHQQKEVITLLFDNYLLSTKKSFLSLRQANEILKKSSDNYLREINLKEFLENGVFSNAKKTEEKPKQWRIFLSKNYAPVEFSLPKKISSKRKGTTEIRKENRNNAEQKKNGIIAISVTSVLLLFVWYISQTPTSSSTKLVSSEYSNSNVNNTEESYSQQNFAGKVFTFISLENDKEYIIGGKLIQTNKEKTIHKFDFINKIVTCKAPLNGKYVTTKYPINGFYEQKGSVATTYVIEVNTLGVKEIWFSPDVPNLGYDYDDGTRIACYELQLKNE